MSVDSTPNATEMAAASTFSYAQAAKGQGATPAQNSTSTDSQAEGAAPAPVAEKTTEAASVPTEVTTSAKSSSRSTASEKQETESVSVVDSETRSESVQEKRSESRRDDDSGRLDRPWRRNDKGTRSSSTTTRSADEHDSRRSRKGKKSKASEKQAGDGAAAAEEKKEEPEQPKIELAEAPIPSVNIWHQRKEQLSKVKPENTGSETTGSAQAAQDPARPTTETNNTSAQAIDPKPAQKESASKPERNGSRGNRLAGRENRDGKTETPPSVQDATLWPTVETAVTAVKEDKKKSTDKTERFEKDSQEDGTQGKPQKKKGWVAYDYVPSVNFETQLPQMRGSKPRGGSKAANNSRAGPGAQAGDKAAPTATTTPPKAGESRDRPREAPNGAPRSAPAQPSSKRASVDVSRSEQRRPVPNASVEKGKDAAGPTNQADQHSGRDGRSERGGRGSYRGRGGHHAANAHAQHQHSASAMAAPSFQPNGTMNPRAPAVYSPPPRQGGHGQMYMPPPARGSRGGRNGSGNYHRMSLPNGTTRPPPVQTQFSSVYDYPIAPMTAVPYQQPAPYWDGGMVITMLRNQVEYYFSLENLCKDMFLRRHMDSQGFVPLMFIAAFKRMQELSPNVSLIRAVCEESPEIDYIVGEDDVERLRSRHSWHTFVLPKKDRDELAKNDGPAHFMWRSRHYHGYSPSNGDAYAVTSPQGFMNQPFPTEYHDGQAMNGAVNGAGNGYGGASQLSAEVPDFAPSYPVGESHGTAKLNPNAEAHAPGVANGYPAEAVNGMTNGNHSQDVNQS